MIVTSGRRAIGERLRWVAGARSNSSSSMLRPVITSTTRLVRWRSRWSSAGERRRRRGLDADPGARQAADRAAPARARRREPCDRTTCCDRARPRTGSRRAPRVRRRSSRRLSSSTTRPASKLSAITGASFGHDADDVASPCRPAPRRCRRSARRFRPGRRPCPACDRSWSAISAADRAVALVLGGLEAVLEERQAVRLGERGDRVLRCRRSRRRPACKSAPSGLDPSELRLRGAARGRRRSHCSPSSRAAHAVAAPWFPVEAVTTVVAPRAA